MRSMVVGEVVMKWLRRPCADGRSVIRGGSLRSDYRADVRGI